MIKAGNTSIPLDCNFCLKLKETLSTRFDKLGDEFAKSISIDYTKESDSLFKEYGTNTRIPINIPKYSIYDIDLVFNNANDKTGVYSAQIVKNKKSWLVCTDETSICNLDLGTTEHVDQNIIDYVQTTGAYDGTYSASPILGNFGNQGEAWLMKDIRYAFSPLDILRKGFKKCGIDFVSPVMENDPHFWSYLLKKNWWENSGQGTLVNAEASSNVTFNTNGLVLFVLPFDNIISDAGNNLSQISSNGVQGISYSNPYPECLDYCICLKMTVTNNSNTDSIWSFGLFVPSIQTFNFKANQTTVIDVCFNLQTTGFTANLALVANNTDLIFTSTNIKIIGKSKNFYKGDILQNNEMLDCNISVLDVLKMVKHRYNGLFEYNKANRTFFMSSPFDTDGVEGFYKPSYKDIKLDNIVCNSKIEGSFLTAANERIYSFADSNDEYISTQIEEGERTDLENEYGVLSSYNVLNQDNTKKDEIPNPLAEPTLNSFSGNFQGGTDLVSLENNLYIPQFLDNTGGNQSNCINPRMFYMFNGTQVVNGEEQNIYLENIILSRYPTIYNEISDNVTITGNNNYNGQDLNYQNIYNKYYSKYVNRIVLGSPESYCLLVDYKKYRNSSFRTKKRIYYKGFEYSFVLVSKSFDSCGNSVKWEFIRENTDC